MSTDLRAEVRKAISDAYYEARNDGQTMETAADNAADAVTAILTARLDATVAELKPIFANVAGELAGASRAAKAVLTPERKR